MQSTEWLQKKIEDYKRFIATLLILSSYLYMGTLISIFEYKSNDYYYLLPLTVSSLLAVTIFMVKINKWQRQIAADDH
ncbi:YrhC family protein [Halobacillus yeomjeoni]|uniref:YrhC-like protein n=1 Tax=Halobacillus yeomjeoni TaxID=311194 RepID=A0A931HV16_9BACI|nr:YrhC family protein [Halobacillus yeomjeoni]MBH0229956.1 hypothetical protein [Halobacillus yeomjeoni]MCA0982666.1 YrhC family protein [Halobacillus yeomjeoni]